MIFPMNIRSLVISAALAVVACPSPAQEAKEKKRMIFPPGEVQPLMDKPTAAPQPSLAKPKPETPEESLAVFFQALAAGQVEGAYERLVKGTTIADRPQDVAALKERTLQALDVCGPFQGYEILEQRTAGQHLVRLTCLSLNSELPLRWRFYFYRSEGSWRLVDLRVDDGLVELFEDSGRRGR